MPVRISTVYTYACEHCGQRVSGENEQAVIREVQVHERKGQPKFRYNIGDKVFLYAARGSSRFSYCGGVIRGTAVEMRTHAALYVVLVSVMGGYIINAHEAQIGKGNVGAMVTGGLRFPVSPRSRQ